MLLPLTILTLAFLQTPDNTLPPTPAQIRYTTIGNGVQIYRCTATPAVAPATTATFTWAFQSPEASIIDPTTGKELGSHSAGPTWTWTDGSAVTGKLLQKHPAADPADIPWLLLETHSTGQPGALSGIAFVRRSNTQAGQSPATGCDAAHLETVIRVPYQATYTFYTAR
jgi:hypothetical protein